MEKQLIEWFEWFHKNPELSYEEYNTTAKIREILTQAGLEILRCTSGYSQRRLPAHQRYVRAGRKQQDSRRMAER